jgi:hypothetical protein
LLGAAALPLALLALLGTGVLERPGDAVAGELFDDVLADDQGAVQRAECFGLLLLAPEPQLRGLLAPLGQLLQVLAGLVREREELDRVVAQDRYTSEGSSPTTGAVTTAMGSAARSCQVTGSSQLSGSTSRVRSVLRCTPRHRPLCGQELLPDPGARCPALRA